MSKTQTCKVGSKTSFSSKPKEITKDVVEINLNSQKPLDTTKDKKKSKSKTNLKNKKEEPILCLADKWAVDNHLETIEKALNIYDKVKNQENYKEIDTLIIMKDLKIILEKPLQNSSS